MRLNKSFWHFPCLIFSLAITLASCSSAADFLQPKAPWPTEGWQTSTPEEHGMDAAKLEQMMDLIEERDAPIDSVLVIRDGYIVFEKYRRGYEEASSHQLQSVTKSFTSTLLGIALQEGLIQSLDQRLVDFYPDRTIDNLDVRKQNITLEDLLTMSEGMDWHEVDLPYTHPDNSLGQMWRQDDVVQHVLDTPMLREPGEAWNYNSGTSILLGNIVEQVSGQSVLMFARQYLFDPLGIGSLYWAMADKSHYHTDGGLYMTPRDMARLGYLMLNGGEWEGEQILPEDWVDHASSAHYQTDGLYGYGYQWWTLPQGGIYTALGHYDQAIYVIPEADMVVVFTANVPDEAIHPEHGLLLRYILGACNDLPDDFLSRHYEGYGFSYDYGAEFSLLELPLNGEDQPSDESGVIQHLYISYPIEIINVSWNNEWNNPDLAVVLDRAFLSMTEGDQAQLLMGEPAVVEVGNRKLHAHRLELEEDGFRLSGITTVWNCDSSNRAYVLSYITDNRITRDAIDTRFGEILGSFTCQE